MKSTYAEITITPLVQSSSFEREKGIKKREFS